MNTLNSSCHDELISTLQAMVQGIGMRGTDMPFAKGVQIGRRDIVVEKSV